MTVTMGGVACLAKSILPRSLVCYPVTPFSKRLPSEEEGVDKATITSSTKATDDRNRVTS
jgi:hypothetical protein